MSTAPPWLCTDAPPLASTAPQILAGQYKSNIALGSEKWEPVAGHASEYRAYDLSAAAADAANSAEQRKDQTSAHYEFGLDALDYSTTGASDYGPHGGKPARLSEKQKAEVREVHFSLGNVKTDYTSEAKLQFSSGRLDPSAGSARAEAAEFKKGARPAPAPPPRPGGAQLWVSTAHPCCFAA